jgi:simple sugar transport system ATP-binding protein
MALIEATNIVKIYPNGVLANDHVHLSVEKGEIHALVGENGAGKSTLMKILYGLNIPLQGVTLRGQQVYLTQAAIEMGIGMVHQNFMLVDSFSIAENITLGTETTRARGIALDRQKAIRDTSDLSQQYGLFVEPTARVDTVPVGMRQRIEILKALYRGADILILDEPTAVLTPRETQDLFRAIRNLVNEGKTVIFITHKLREVMAISDRVTVMRDAKTVGTVNTPETNERELARMMVGREVFMQVDKPPIQQGQPVLDVRGLTYVNEVGRTLLRDATFTCYEAEILGIAGVEGNGQTELVEVLTGLRKASAGEACVDGQPVLGHGPRKIREAHVAHIPEDRLTNGVAVMASVGDNLIVDRYYRPPLTQMGVLDLNAIRANSADLITQFNILAPSADLPVGSLSGGNMQRVVLARELSSNPRLLIAAQPTRGVDIGAIEYIHQQLVDQRTNGLAILGFGDRRKS